MKPYISIALHLNQTQNCTFIFVLGFRLEVTNLTDTCALTGDKLKRSFYIDQKIL